MTWLEEERHRAAVTRILDATAELVATEGLAAAGMARIAESAGCSRATLYRHFPDRRALLLAFVQREALRVASRIPTSGGIADAVARALVEVRATPALAAWFAPDAAATAADLALSSEVVAAVVRSMVDDDEDARWLVRVVLSLLTTPEPDAAAERRMIERYVAPSLTRTPSRRSAAARRPVRP